MIGVVIGIGPVWQECAEDAAVRMQRYTGLKCHVVSDWPRSVRLPPSTNPSWLKLWMQECLFPGEDLLLFDADLFCRKPWDPAEALGIHDLCWVLAKPFHTRGVFSFPKLDRECEECGLDMDRYGNCGLMLIKSSCTILKEAQKFCPVYGSWLEQTGVNRAVQDRPDLSIGTLPPAYNWTIPSRVWLKDLDQVWGADPVNLHLCRMRGNRQWLDFARKFLLEST